MVWGTVSMGGSEQPFQTYCKLNRASWKYTDKPDYLKDIKKAQLAFCGMKYFLQDNTGCWLQDK